MRSTFVWGRRDLSGALPVWPESDHANSVVGDGYPLARDVLRQRWVSKHASAGAEIHFIEHRRFLYTSHQKSMPEVDYRVSVKDIYCWHDA